MGTPEIWANNATTTLVAPALATDTTIQVAPVVYPVFPFPASGGFRIAVDQGAYVEYMLVTSVSGNTWTVTRGIEGSIATPHLAGAPVQGTITAGGMAAVALPSLANAAALAALATTLLAPGKNAYVQSLKHHASEHRQLQRAAGSQHGRAILQRSIGEPGHQWRRANTTGATGEEGRAMQTAAAWIRGHAGWPAMRWRKRSASAMACSR
jgi:hypothetical protein